MWRRLIPPALLAGLVFVGSARGEAQTLSQRGFGEVRVTLYPQDAPNDRVNVVTDLLLRDEVFVKPAPWIQFAAGFEFRRVLRKSRAQCRRYVHNRRAPLHAR